LNGLGGQIGGIGSCAKSARVGIKSTASTNSLAWGPETY